MSEKVIYSVEFEFPGNVVEDISWCSKNSLLDADIIVFNPEIPDVYQVDFPNATFNGKKCFNNTSSFSIKEYSKHWKRELTTAFNGGKTIFIFLNEFTDFFVHTGKKDVSGTGRNARTTNIVEPYNNYKCIPFINKIIPTSGSIIILAADLKWLSYYWQEFKQYSSYEIYLEDEIGEPLLKTKTNNKVVGTAILGDSNKGEGNVIFLPMMPIAMYNQAEFTKYKNEEAYWNKKGIVFGKKLANCFIEIDKVLKSTAEKSPKPDWLNNNVFRLKQEDIYEEQTKLLSSEINKLEQQKMEINSKLENTNHLKRLLYENGTQLEDAIIESLGVLGFNAENYQDSKSEFDAVFSCKEGAFLCEAEGKDNKAIDVTKVRQLTTNIQEYYDKFEKLPKGILFGNAYRYTIPEERKDFFTQKCISIAEQFNIILIKTTDLFCICKYLKENVDENFMKLCREQIFKTKQGIVTFPEIPIASSSVHIV